MRSASAERNTRETRIRMTLSLDCAGTGALRGSTGVGFFDHMLNSFCVHGGFQIDLNMEGDLETGSHHTVEDTGIVLGGLFKDILGDRAGIARYGSACVPMDESLAFSCADISGRPYFVFNGGTGDTPLPAVLIAGYETEMTAEFFRALAFGAGITFHLRLLYGTNIHHMVEALYKAAARALSAACMPTGTVGVLSAKGVL